MAELVSWMRRWWCPHSNRPFSTLVAPPSLKAMSWWAWHIAAGTSQSSAVQPRSRTPMAMRMGSVWKRHLVPASSTTDFPPRTTGMIPARQARRGPARQRCGRRCPGCTPRRVELVHQLFESHRHHDRGADTARAGQPVGVDGFDDLGERDALAHGLGQVGIDATAAGGVVTHRVGQGLDRLAQHRRMQGGDTELPVRDTLVVLPHREGGLAGRLGFLGLELLALVGLSQPRGRRPRRSADPGWPAAWRRTSRPRPPGAPRPAARCSALTTNSPARAGSRPRCTITRAWAVFTPPSVMPPPGPASSPVAWPA